MDSLNLELGDLHGEGWQLHKVQVRVDHVQASGGEAEIRIGRAQIKAFPHSLENLRWVCPHFSLQAARLKCQRSTLNTALPLIDSLSISFEYNLDNGVLDFSLARNHHDARGRFDLNGKLESGAWQFALTTQDLDLQALQQTFSSLHEILATWNFTGKADLEARVSSQGQDGPAITLHGKLSGFNYANPAGSQAGENLDLRLEISATDSHHVVLGLALNNAELYTEPLYFQYHGRYPLTLDAELNWYDSVLAVDKLQYTHPDVGSLHGEVELDFAAPQVLRTLKLETSALQIARLYQAYMQNYLADQNYKPLDVDGMLTLRTLWSETRREIDVTMQNFSLFRAGENTENGLLITGVNSDLHWQGSDSPQLASSHLSWRGANLPPTIAVGPGALTLRLYGENLHLLESFSIPILDGALRVETLNIKDILSSEPIVEYSGLLQPISMSALSQAMGWPELGGQISGMVPELRYTGKRLEIGGALLVKVFGGDIVLHRLGVQVDTPVLLNADIKVNRLDLHTLTQFFSFGEITGKLSGYINQMQMRDWQVESFDAFFATPEDDTSSRKISQKAINNLSSLGGSQVTKALSRSVLQIFNHFSYDRLGWGCHLHNGLCEMRGIARAEGGYYIVKGSRFPPRIDILGYNQRVDWNDLWKRLQSLAKAGDPVFE